MSYVVGLCLHLASMVFLCFWSPSEQTLYVFFVVVTVWGIGDGALVNQTTSKYNHTCQ